MKKKFFLSSLLKNFELHVNSDKGELHQVRVNILLPNCITLQLQFRIIKYFVTNEHLGLKWCENEYTYSSVFMF